MELCEQSLLMKIAEARFACVELQLYLDTHPEDAVATADFNCYADALQKLIQTYEQEYGPLQNFGDSQHEAGSWVYGKWPWQL